MAEPMTPERWQELVDAGLVDGWPEWQVRIARAAALGEQMVWQPARRHGVATAKREIAELFRAAGYEVMEATPGPIRGNQANRVWVDEITGDVHTDGKW